MTVESSISLTDEQDAFVRSLVRAGRYSSVSAVVQQGLDLLRQSADAEKTEAAVPRQLLEERRHGSVVTGEKVLGRVAALSPWKGRTDGF